MIPERRIFKAADAWESQSTYDFSKIKDAFAYAGATNIQDVESDVNGGFTMLLGNVPMHIVKTSSGSNATLQINIGPNDEYSVRCYYYSSPGQNPAVMGMVVYKGSTGIFIGTIHKTEMPIYLCLDTITNIVYAVGYIGSSSLRVAAFKYEDNVLTTDFKTIGKFSAYSDTYIPGNGYNLTEQAVIKRPSWFGTQMSTGVQCLLSSLYTNDPRNEEVVKVDNTYYISLFGTSMYDNSNLGYINKRGTGSVVFPLGQ